MDGGKRRKPRHAPALRLPAGTISQSASGPAIVVSKGYSHLLNEWKVGYGIFQENRVPLNEAEATWMLNVLYQYWNRHKSQLNTPMSPYLPVSIAEEFRDRFQYIIGVLACVVIPNLGESCNEETKSRLHAFLAEMDEMGLVCGTAQIAAVGVSTSRFDEIWERYQRELLKGEQTQVESVLLGCVVLLWMKANGKTSLDVENQILIAPIVECIKTRSISSLVSAMSNFGYILERLPSYIRDENMKNVCFGLGVLASDSDISNENSTLQEHIKLLLRVRGMTLASSLYRFFQNNGKEIPEEIQLWRNISESQNEFWEVRNAWKIG